MLLPENRFRLAARKAGPGIEGILSLAQQFEVSLSCAAIRVVASEVYPAVLIKWSSDGIAWKWASHSFWNFGFRRINATKISLPRDSATSRALAAGSGGGQVVENATTAAYWFSVADKGIRNLVLREQAISLGKFGALTLLSLHKGNFPPEIVALRDHELGLDERY